MTKCTSSTSLGGSKRKSASEGFLYDTSGRQGREEWLQMGRSCATRNGKSQCCSDKGVISGRK